MVKSKNKIHFDPVTVTKSCFGVELNVRRDSKDDLTLDSNDLTLDSCILRPGA